MRVQCVRKLACRRILLTFRSCFIYVGYLRRREGLVEGRRHRHWRLASRRSRIRLAAWARRSSRLACRRRLNPGQGPKPIGLERGPVPRAAQFLVVDASFLPSSAAVTRPDIPRQCQCAQEDLGKQNTQAPPPNPWLCSLRRLAFRRKILTTLTG